MSLKVAALFFTVGVLLLLLSMNPVKGHLRAGVGRNEFAAGFGREEPTNVWAVEITGGDKNADEIAKKYGFINHGKVGNLETVYRFEMPVKQLDGFGSRELLDKHISSGLGEESLVTMVERQYRKHLVPKKNH